MVENSDKRRTDQRVYCVPRRGRPGGEGADGRVKPVQDRPRARECPNTGRMDAAGDGGGTPHPVRSQVRRRALFDTHLSAPSFVSKLIFDRVRMIEGFDLGIWSPSTVYRVSDPESR